MRCHPWPLNTGDVWQRPDKNIPGRHVWVTADSALYRGVPWHNHTVKRHSFPQELNHRQVCRSPQRMQCPNGNYINSCQRLHFMWSHIFILLHCHIISRPKVLAWERKEKLLVLSCFDGLIYHTAMEDWQLCVNASDQKDGASLRFEWFYIY